MILKCHVLLMLKYTIFSGHLNSSFPDRDAKLEFIAQGGRWSPLLQIVFAARRDFNYCNFARPQFGFLAVENANAADFAE